MCFRCGHLVVVGLVLLDGWVQLQVAPRGHFHTRGDGFPYQVQGYEANLQCSVVWCSAVWCSVLSA